MRKPRWATAIILLFASHLCAESRLNQPVSLPLKGSHTPQQVSLINDPVPIGSDDELVIEGDNPSPLSTTLILRVDDTASVGYGSRVNLERIIPPGPFTLRFALSEWRTNQPRALALDKLTDLYLFTADTTSAMTIKKWYWTAGLTLPSDTIALDLGPADAPRFSGFDAVTPGDPRLIGHPTPILRPSGDALIRDGLRNLDGLNLAVPPGRYELTLWLDDPGEWEYVPHPLERTVLINGEPIWAEQWQPQQWLKHRYLAGQMREALPNPDPWQLLGASQGGPVTITLTHAGGPFNVQLIGHSPEAKFLAGLLLTPAPKSTAQPRGAVPKTEPSPHSNATLLVRAKQQQLFTEKWALAPYKAIPATSSLGLRPIASSQPTLGSTINSSLSDQQSPIIAARGSQLLLTFVIDSPWDDPTPLLVIQPPTREDKSLPLTPYYGQWHLTRPQASGTLLTPSDQELVEGLAGLTLQPSVPRRIVLHLPIPNDAPAGIYQGSIQLLSKHQLVQQPVQIEILPLRLPASLKPIGIYLEAPPYFNWLNQDTAQASQQIEAANRCDLTRLAQLGITGLSPALPQDDAGIRNAISEAMGFGFQPPLLAYTPLKRWGTDLATQLTAWQRQQAALKKNALPPLAWSLFDEPELASLPSIINLAQEMKRRDPLVIRAGHFNHPDQAPLLAEVEIALINTGFGADKSDVIRVRNAGAQPWFYNLGSPRAAGFYLWQSGAQGYLQWHGRMPTAKPYDPTDGRESDFLWLGPQACEAHRLSQDLLMLQQAIEDLRWLQWLEDAARYQVDAALLLRDLRRQIPTRWHDAEQQSPYAWEALRQPIEQLAKRLKTLQTEANLSP
ncbi:hypothetical protein [Aeromonas cavernicola]|uniref:Glycoside hydrolase 123 C-terminal domain-containing protein n=1 Tax=Aeromonas cavernicola TaxID=1006623 RepID=A0A2H9U7X9_9GAMM|nr:hypothetical protein [Aeromonas cavernicola]PJG60146.1 hypothetical protein CUC53_03350 [Aeromonas cavernicola]